MGLNAAAYVLGKKYTDDTAIGLGAVIGAPCTIKGITEDADKNQLVEFEWTGTDGTKKTRVMTVPAGVSITGFTKIDDTHFVWNFSNGTTSASIEYPKQQIPISEESGNAIIEKDDGLYVSTTGVEISAESNNAIQTKTDGLYVDVPVKSVSLDGTEITPDATGNIDISISDDTDNLITVESDGLKVAHDDDKVDVDQTVENAGKALIVGADGKVTTGDAGVKVSAKTGNDIETITDVGEEGIYVSVPVKSVSVGTNELTPDTDGKVTIPVSADTDNLITYETDGLKVAHDSDKVDIDQTVANAGKALIVGDDGLVTVGDAGVKVSSKEGNTIQEITDPGEEGIFVPEGLKVSPKEGNIIQTITDVGEEGIYAVKGAVEVSQEENNMLDSKTDGLFVDGSTWRDIQEYTEDEIDALFTGTPETVEAYANLIKDDITSELSLWSSKKVSDRISAIIDNENSTETTAYSSVKVDDLLDNINPSWNGTKAEWESLDKSTLKNGQTINITDDYADKSIIDDSATSGMKTWSSSKINANLGELESILNKINKPNLLDNPFFTINQRGKSELTVGTATSYFVDRWYSARSNIKVVDNGISLAWNGASSSSGYIAQKIDDYEKYIGKVVTISAIINGNLHYITGKFPTKGGTSVNTDYTLENNTIRLLLEFTSTMEYPQVAIASNKTTENVITAVKLELGGVSTLANDVAPNYATELMKCKRYYQRIIGSAMYFSFVAGTNSSSVYFPFLLEREMRANPTVTCSAMPYIGEVSSGSTQATNQVTALTCSTKDLRLLEMKATTTSAVPNGVAKIYLKDSNTTIEFSADL